AAGEVAASVRGERTRPIGMVDRVGRVRQEVLRGELDATEGDRIRVQERRLDVEVHDDRGIATCDLDTVERGVGELVESLAVRADHIAELRRRRATRIVDAESDLK